ncbi:MAG: GTPase HflX [Phycisphaerales bacterium]|nr:GTPase HflX [Phycisphaerales bacterium]
METGSRSDIGIQAERAVLVGILLPGTQDQIDPLAELRALSDTAGVLVVGEMIQSRKTPEGRTYLGKGKVEELAAMAAELRAKVVIFDNDLSPSQLKNLEEVTSVKVLDRTELILDIFANRATTRAAQLQVEIAQLEYTAPRLRAMWSHLGQVTGGSPMGVGTRGPGEKQIEIDRRLVSRRLTQLKRELSEVQARRSREIEQRRREHFTVCIVGYTNAGKSTLFNALTAGGAYADNKLFATLHTRVEGWNIGSGDMAMLSDTVGFIRNLPHRLVASFKSTLEDAVAAHLLLLVVDAADPSASDQLRVVREVLDEIGAAHQPRLIVLNKSDLLGEDAAERVEALKANEPGAISVSGRTGAGLDSLRDAVRGKVLGEWVELLIEIPLAEGRTVDFLERRTQVIERDYTETSVLLRTKLSRRHLEQLAASGSRSTIGGKSPADALTRSFPERSVLEPRRVSPHEKLGG